MKEIIDERQIILEFDFLILPGVGAFENADTFEKIN